MTYSKIPFHIPVADELSAYEEYSQLLSGDMYSEEMGQDAEPVTEDGYEGVF